MPFYAKGDVRIRYEVSGAGFPLFIIYGGGLNSNVNYAAPFNPVREFSGEYRCITMDLRNANGGESTGPLDLEQPWNAHTLDQIGLLDHLGVERFFMMGFCIGNPMIWNMQKLAPGRMVAAVSAQPSGVHPDHPDFFFHNNMKIWVPGLLERNPALSRETVERYLHRMYDGVDFVLTVDRDFVRSSTTPLLVLPDDVPSHPYTVAMEMVGLAPQAQVSLFPWKHSPDTIRLAVRHVRTFLKAHCPPND